MMKAAQEDVPAKVDSAGLPITTLNRQLYARHNCTDCWGTGELRYVATLKKQRVDTKIKTVVLQHKPPLLDDCHCVTRKYTRLRKEVDRRLEKAMKAAALDVVDSMDGKLVAARAAALKEIVDNLGFGEKNV